MRDVVSRCSTCWYITVTFWYSAALPWLQAQVHKHKRGSGSGVVVASGTALPCLGCESEMQEKQRVRGIKSGMVVAPGTALPCLDYETGAEGQQ